MSPTEPDIAGYAERIMTDIDDDIAGGALPASVRSFTDLHDYLDANDYLQAAGVPYDATPATIDVIVAVQEEVNRRLADPGRPYCTYGTCHYAKHDHTTTQGPDGQELDPPVPMRCNDCGQPAHYDEKLEDYRHDDPAAPDCFLIHRIHRAQPIPAPVDQLPVEAAFTTTHYPPGTHPGPRLRHHLRRALNGHIALAMVNYRWQSHQCDFQPYMSPRSTADLGLRPGISTTVGTNGQRYLSPRRVVSRVGINPGMRPPADLLPQRAQFGSW